MSEFSQTTSLVISLEPCGDPGSAYRVQNKSPQEIQRQHLVDRGSGSDLALQADLVKVIHGHMHAGGPPATLIVAEFKFLSFGNSRRFREATIELLFATIDGGDPDGSEDPEVLDIAPAGKYSMNQTTAELGETRSAGVTGTAGGSPASAGITLSWQMSKSFQKGYQASVIGVKRIEGRNQGKKNLARWALLENPNVRDGIPTLLRSAILIQRENDDRFIAMIKIEGKVNVLYKLQNALQDLLGRVQKDDPVFFDPAAPPAGGIPDDMNIEELKSYDLMKLISAEYSNPL